MLIGEAPGKEEIKKKTYHLWGRSGQLLMEQLQQVGSSRENGVYHQCG